ncbi:MAG: insulinase family protein [Mogibacterium sp.]|nr:insulinase family protein [Mogibacterium sp.]
MNVNDKICGFTVTRIRDITEIEGRLVEMTHEKTGARLVWTDNKAENKLFSVGFKTLPEDSTGVFHILEHSVLCGSEKFPVKEPFVELLKTSMNTFLNAMTYQDKTLYPVSSRVKQDYLNLMEVYLDAVFKPNILVNPDIFYQEGWHIDTTEDEPAFKGVVFNEMKGAMSDVDQLAERTMLKMLFPNNCYGYNSGGDPDAIVDLTYEQFIDTYNRYYHPTNSYFYLDGDIPVHETLTLINSYLEGYERLHVVPRIVTQHPTVEKRTIKFAAANEDDKGVVVCSRIIGTWEDKDMMFAMSVVLEQLTDSNESPVKRAVLSSGLAEDMEIYISDGISQPYIMMIFRGVENPGRDSSKLLEIVCDTVNKAVEDGISHRDFEASINRMDFRFRQLPEPQALYRANAAFASWLYGGDPALQLETNKTIANLRQMVETGEFERIAAEVLGDKRKFSILCMNPDTEYGKSEAEAEAKFVKATVHAMNDDEKAALEKMNEDLLAWQQTPDSDEDVAKIPMLELSDIDPMPELIATEIKEASGKEVIFHPVHSNGIVYINAYYPITQLSLEELPAAALMIELFKDLPTENYDVLALQNEIRMHVGAISFDMVIMSKDGDTTNCTPCIKAAASVLEDKLSYAEELIMEILTRTKWDDKALIRELITQIDEDTKRSAMASGHRLAMYTARAQWSSKDAVAEAVNAYTFLQYMHKMCEASDEDLEAFAEFAQRTIKESVTKQNAKLSVTSSNYADISGLVEKLPDGIAQAEKVSYTTKLPNRLGIAIPSAVSYSAITYDMSDAKVPMSGHMAVSCTINSLSHLWNEIRVQGGAYGAGMTGSRTGSLCCYTYRDPNPARSLDVYKTVPDFLNDTASAEDFNPAGYIISSVSSTEPLLSPGAKGRAGDDFYFSDFTEYDRVKFRREMLETTADDIKAQCEVLREMFSRGSVCVVGPKETLEGIENLELVEL